MTAEQAIEKMKAGNRAYLASDKNLADISSRRRKETCQTGQHPYAIVVTCSDARVVPEMIFSAGIGDLFTIRTTGNVIDDHQFDSIEYAVQNLESPVIVVLGHTHCDAVDSARKRGEGNYIRFVTDAIRLAIGNETEAYKAGCLNVQRGVALIKRSFPIRCLEEEEGFQVLGAMYDLETGEVEFLPI